jgi:hypothetical protein
VKRRPAPRYSSLTSLLDVLFILVFASLVQSAALVEGAAAEPVEAEQADDEAPAVVSEDPDAGVPSIVDEIEVVRDAALDHGELADRAVAELTESLRQREVLFARVSREGTITAIERVDGEQVSGLELEVPLLARVPDPDVAVRYLGERNPELRVCSVVRQTLERDDLDGALVIIVPEVGLGELVVALVDGLRRDQERCFGDEGALGVVVEPGRHP